MMFKIYYLASICFYLCLFSPFSILCDLEICLRPCQIFGRLILFLPLSQLLASSLPSLSGTHQNQFHHYLTKKSEKGLNHFARYLTNNREKRLTRFKFPNKTIIIHNDMNNWK